MSSCQQLIKQLINDHRVMLFTKTYCPYCNKAKKLLNNLNVSFHAEELDVRPDGSEIQNELEKMTRQRTVPNIFIKGKHIGGSDDLQKLCDSKQLQKMLD